MEEGASQEGQVWESVSRSKTGVKEWRMLPGDSFSITIPSANPSVLGGALSRPHTHEVGSEVTFHLEVRARGLNCRSG